MHSPRVDVMFVSTEPSARAQGLRPFDDGSSLQSVGTDPVSQAAMTGAALVRHLDDLRFAALRALRQLLRALDAERIALGRLDPRGAVIHEDLVWVSGFGRCGESERKVSCKPFAALVKAWVASGEDVLGIPIGPLSPAWPELPCDHLLLVRTPEPAGGQGYPVILAQLRGVIPLPDAAPRAIGILLKAYAQRCAVVGP